jgi:hypothetical protein
MPHARKSSGNFQPAQKNMSHPDVEMTHVMEKPDTR